MHRPTLVLTRRQTLGAAGTIGLAGCQGLDPAPSADLSTASRNQTGQSQTVRAFVASYHWGYVLLDESGDELDQLTLSVGDELRLTVVNVEADDAVASLPRSVRTGIPDEAERQRRNENRVRVGVDVSMDALHEVATSLYPDHGLAIVPAWATNSTDGGSGRPPGPGGPGSGGPGGGRGGHHGPHDGYGPGSGGGGGHHGGPYGPSGGTRGPWAPGMHRGGSSGYGWGWTLAPETYLWHHATVPAEMGFVVETTGTYGFACPVYCGYGHPYMFEEERIVVEDG